ncbi:acyl-CoA transferase [Mameliella sp. CS4]|uniref:acyl-CoA transferase n=1 Tax=Mameliella sp. CS4 TaxID=2862329 RepID=UPI001C5ED5B0|nr:acyl-CoA transferase [Mameliella sp. CS4]MBW4984135.1 acyl-CoA transferase [Mameliella sp. CS4]
MPSDVEARMSALYTLANGAVTGGVERNLVVPEAIPAAGLVIMRDGRPAVESVTLPRTYHLDHDVEFEFYAQGATGREAVTDARRQELGAAIEADRTLGGLCDWVEAQPVESDDQRVQGGKSMRVDVVRVTLSYATTNPLT